MSESLIEYFDKPARIVADGETYELHPLDMNDRVAAEARIRDERINSLLKKSPSVKWLPNEVLSDALAKVVCQPVGSDELLGTYESQVALIALSLSHGDSSFNGEAGVKKVRSFPPVTVKVLQSILWAITGLEKPKEDDEDGHPTDESPTSSDHSTAGAS